MRSIARGLRIAAGALCCTVLGVVSPAGATPTVGQSVPAVFGSEPALANVHCIDPTILVELRYASRRNFTQRALYPAEMPALVRPSVAYRLAAAQTFLRAHGYRLKIWDAYRPKPVHEQLWRMSQNRFFVANPEDGVGSLHTWGVAVDATLVNADGHDDQCRLISMSSRRLLQCTTAEMIWKCARTCESCNRSPALIRA